MISTAVGFLLTNSDLFRRLVRGLRRTAERRGVVFLAVAILASTIAFNVALLPRGPGSSSGKNVVLITIDTLRADHLKSYGYNRPTAPNVDALAKEGILFQRAIAQAPWTLPSMATLHSSLYPSQHGAYRYSFRMHERVMTLAEHFKNENYRTIGVVSHTFVNSTYGFAQGFDVFDESHIMQQSGVSSDKISTAAVTYIRRSKDKRFFLWLHYFDPHYDYV